MQLPFLLTTVFSTRSLHRALPSPLSPSSFPSSPVRQPRLTLAPPDEEDYSGAYSPRPGVPLCPGHGTQIDTRDCTTEDEPGTQNWGK